ncbi:MAG: TRAP transporter fused permease subunit [Burkholderiaceae bacterium]
MSRDETRFLNGERGGRAIALAIGLIFVLIGLVHNTPSIPGLDEMVTRWAQNPTFSIRKFPYEWLYPLAFAMMMVIVVCQHSIARHMRDRHTAWRAFGWFMDAAMLIMSLMVAATYLIEIESICLIDQFTGERAKLIAEALQAEQEMARNYGLPIPETVEDPQCLNTTGVWLFAVMGLATAVFLAYNVKVWGLPLVGVAIVLASYALITVAIWYIYGADDMNRYLVTKLGGEPRQLLDGRPNVHDILVSNNRGYLGQFLAVLMDIVFPYIILGALFGASAGGQALIKIAFRLTRRLRGGPGHAAIVSSALFGTISGGPVVNVLSTGQLTIPMMRKRGFSAVFAGGIEAAASSGGQIMPPVMGVAAFVLAALTLVPYSEVIVAAALPAFFYFFCLFLSVMFEARKQNIQAMGEITAEMRLNRQEKANLLMIALPILLILVLLLTPKEAVGCGPFGWLLGASTTIDAGGDCIATELPWLLQLAQNSAGDAGSAGWWSVVLLLVLLFIDPQVRAAPIRIINALADSGVLISTLYLMFLAVTVIDVSLSFTGLSDYLSRDILGWLRGLNISADETPMLLMLALLVTMALAVLLGMGMPTVPAYINVALLMGPMLIGLGIATFTAHMFVFYFAVASAITPPVAIAAFAAASLTQSDPMATGFSAVRSGIVMFVIPFVFAFYPELLLIDAAMIDAGSGAPLPGYENGIEIGALLWLLARLIVALYLLSSALVRFDRGPVSGLEMILRLALAVGIVMAQPPVYGLALVATAGLLFWHARRARAQLPGVAARAGSA